MKIGINCLSVKTNYVGGVTSFTLGILDGFLEINSNNTFQIYTNKYNNYLFDKYKKNKNVSIIVLENYTKLKKAVSDLSMLFFSRKNIQNNK